MSIPKEVTFQRLPPIAYPSKTQITRFYPQTNNQLSPGDICRFNISTMGYWDPYTAHIEFEVDLSQETALDDYDVLQIDGSASSFIGELVISCKGGEVERITEYDVISNIIEDMTLNNEQRQARDIQGLGNNSRAFNKSAGSALIENQPVYGINGGAAKTIDGYGRGGAKPWAPIHYVSGLSATPTTSFLFAENLALGISNDNNWQWANMAVYDKSTWVGLANSALGGFAQGVNDSLSLAFSTPSYSNVSRTPEANLLNLGIPFCFDNDLTQGCFEPFLCKNGFTSSTFLDGKFAAAKPQKRRFSIPFYSGCLGQLMPKESYKYLPMQALQDLQIEFRMNQFAMFSNGYKVYSNGTFLADGADNIKSKGIVPRKWKIRDFQIVVDILTFDKTIDSLIQDQLNTETGITFHTNSWYLGPIYNVPAGTNPTGTYQLNLGFESLKNIHVCFIPQDYYTLPFLRKLYRVNCGITTFQLRIGTELYPSLPLKGHAGTSAHYPSTYAYYNNTDYLISLYKAWGKFQNKDEDSSITSNNFAVNERYWRPNAPDFGIPADNTVNVNSDSNSIFSNIGGYAPLIHNNRCKGKAVFAMDLQSMSENPSVISGLNTIKNRPFEVLLQSDADSVYRSDKYIGGSGTNLVGNTANVSMYIWCNYDLVVQLRKYGVSIMGRGGGI